MSQGWKHSARCTPRFVLIIAGLMSLSMGVARPALAAGPQERIGEILATVSAVMHDPHLQGTNQQLERQQRVRRIIFDAFDFTEMGRVALGAHWAKLTGVSADRVHGFGRFKALGRMA